MRTGFGSRSHGRSSVSPTGGSRRRVAVALKYEPEKDGAPRVVAQGAGFVADQLVQAAEASKVPIVVEPSIAEALLRVPVGQSIPPAVYQAVAQILAAVLQWENQVAASRSVQTRSERLTVSGTTDAILRSPAATHSHDQ